MVEGEVVRLLGYPDRLQVRAADKCIALQIEAVRIEYDSGEPGAVLETEVAEFLEVVAYDLDGRDLVAAIEGILSDVHYLVGLSLDLDR